MPATRRPDSQPETPADTRFFELRAGGYTGPINQDGYTAPIDQAPAEPAQPARASVTAAYRRRVLDRIGP